VVTATALLIGSDDLTLVIGHQTYNSQIFESGVKVDRVSETVPRSQASRNGLPHDRLYQAGGHFSSGSNACPTEVEPNPRTKLDAEKRLLDVSDQPASKGYIMYVNSPTNWTPVPLPDQISEFALAPRNNNNPGRNRAGGSAVRCRRRDDEGVCQNRIWLQSESQDRKL
jgi:hypothetical protein